MFVLDCSVSAAWCLQDESSKAADRVVARLMVEEQRAWLPLATMDQTIPKSPFFNGGTFALIFSLTLDKGGYGPFLGKLLKKFSPLAKVYRPGA
jgi:hypothetical protein